MQNPSTHSFIRITSILSAMLAILLAAPVQAATLMYVTNNTAHTVSQISDTGVVSPFIASNQGLSFPSGIVRSNTGDFYISNNGNSVRKYAPAGGFGSPFSGNGLNGVAGLAISPSGELYAAEPASNEISKINLVDGAVTFFANAGSGTTPYGITFDASGNLYVAANVTNQVKKITPGGAVSTFGTGMNGPAGLAFDSTGNLYVSNLSNNTIRKVAPDGTSTNFVTSGLSGPRGMAFDALGNLYVANYSGNTISKITSGGTVSTFATGLSNPAFIAIIVPEPSTLMLLGFVPMFLARKRR